MTIELRLTEVDPPASEPARTIYHDIASLPDPVIQGMTIRYFNYDDVGLYMKITGSGTGYTFTPVNLGLLASGANAYKNLDALASRAKPTAAQLPNGEMTENITLTLKAYTDSGYTTLKWTFDRVVTVIWINSADAAFTVDELDNFDDGTVQGWAARHIDYGIGFGTLTPVATVAVAVDYVLSASYSCKMKDGQSVSLLYSPWWIWIRGELYKSFTSANKSKVFAVIDARLAQISTTNYYGKQLQILRDTTLLINLGLPPDSVLSAYFPTNKWVRIVVPLPANTTFELKIRGAVAWGSDSTYIGDIYTAIYIDDFKIISK